MPTPLSHEVHLTAGEKHKLIAVALSRRRSLKTTINPSQRPVQPKLFGSTAAGRKHLRPLVGSTKRFHDPRSIVLGGLPSPLSPEKLALEPSKASLHHHHSQVRRTRLQMIVSASCMSAAARSCQQPNQIHDYIHCLSVTKFEPVHCEPLTASTLKKFLEACLCHPGWSSIYPILNKLEAVWFTQLSLQK